MLLVFDIGNTAATYGIYKNGHLIRFGSCLYSDIPNIIKNCYISGRNIKPINIVVSSVVPKITQKIKKQVKSLNSLLWIVGENLPVPIRHAYPNNNSLGMDRIVNTYGVLQLYKLPTLIIDFGTAVTFDLVSTRKVFEGGLIIPGPELSFQALIKRAAKLPKNARLPYKTKSFLGKNTLDCLSSGILEGYGALTDGLIEKFRAKYGKGLNVIATGGFANHLKPYTRRLKIIDPQHSVKSLFLLFKQHNF